MSAEQWRCMQIVRDPLAPWDTDPDNRCGSCGRKTASREFMWLWMNDAGRSGEYRGFYCTDCGPPAGEPKGVDVAALAREASAAKKLKGMGPDGPGLQTDGGAGTGRL